MTEANYRWWEWLGLVDWWQQFIAVINNDDHDDNDNQLES